MANETQIPKGPPAPEVALRTLSSDAKSIASGEVDPQPTLVSPPVVSNMGELITAEKVKEDQEGGARKKKSGAKKMILWALVIILVLAIIAVVVFWLLPKLSGGSNIEVTLPAEEEA